MLAALWLHASVAQGSGATPELTLEPADTIALAPAEGEGGLAGAFTAFNDTVNAAHLVLRVSSLAAVGAPGEGVVALECASAVVPSSGVLTEGEDGTWSATLAAGGSLRVSLRFAPPRDGASYRGTVAAWLERPSIFPTQPSIVRVATAFAPRLLPASDERRVVARPPGLLAWMRGDPWRVRDATVPLLGSGTLPSAGRDALLVGVLAAPDGALASVELRPGPADADGVRTATTEPAAKAAPAAGAAPAGCPTPAAGATPAASETAAANATPAPSETAAASATRSAGEPAATSPDPAPSAVPPALDLNVLGIRHAGTYTGDLALPLGDAPPAHVSLTVDAGVGFVLPLLVILLGLLAANTLRRAMTFQPRLGRLRVGRAEAARALDRLASLRPRRSAPPEPWVRDWRSQVDGLGRHRLRPWVLAVPWIDLESYLSERERELATVAGELAAAERLFGPVSHALRAGLARLLRSVREAELGVHAHAPSVLRLELEARITVVRGRILFRLPSRRRSPAWLDDTTSLLASGRPWLADAHRLQRLRVELTGLAGTGGAVPTAAAERLLARAVASVMLARSVEDLTSDAARRRMLAATAAVEALCARAAVAGVAPGAFRSLGITKPLAPPRAAGALGALTFNARSVGTWLAGALGRVAHTTLAVLPRLSARRQVVVGEAVTVSVALVVATISGMLTLYAGNATFGSGADFARAFVWGFGVTAVTQAGLEGIAQAVAGPAARA